MVEQLHVAGLGARVWTVLPDETSPAFRARRMASESLVHRADAALAVGAEFIDLTGDVPVLHRTAAPAAVTVRAAPTAFLLFLHGRPLPDGALGVTGDRELLTLWRDRAAFWLT